MDNNVLWGNGGILPSKPRPSPTPLTMACVRARDGSARLLAAIERVYGRWPGKRT